MNKSRSSMQGGRVAKARSRSRVTGSIPAPTLLVDFAKNQYSIKGEAKTFDQIFGMVRSTVGMVTGPDGLLALVQPNMPRLDYDPVTLSPLGILIEEGRTNLLVNSQQLQTLAKNSNAVVDGNMAQAPDGTMTAARMTLDANAISGVYKSTFSTPAQVVWSCYVRYVSGSGIIRMGMEGSAYGDSQGATFNLLTGATTLVGASVTPGIERGPLGYWRISMTRPIVATENQLTNVTLYSGDAVAGKVYEIWGGQVEAGRSKTSLIPTQAAAVPRSGDVPANSDIAPWYNLGSGTLFVEFEPGVIGLGNTAVGAWVSQVAVASSIICIRKGNSQGDIYAVISNKTAAISLNAVMSSKRVPIGASCKAALSFDPDSAIMALDGGPSTVKAEIDMPLPERMTIGSAGNGQQFCNGHVKRVLYFSKKLTESQLRGLTK